VLGTGVVGTTIAGKLRELGHDVLIGSRTAGEDAVPFADAAAHGELVFNCTNGNASLDALGAAGAENLAGKVLVDVANVLDFSQGRPPLVGVSTGDSLGEQIQRAFPEARVVKALNTVNANVMVDPGVVPGEHDFSCPETTNRRRLKSRSCCRASGGMRSASSTSATSPRHVLRSCTSRSGYG
jgi:8-hydroxy-5-deazaflavin:NADPH oxidoreductase